MSAAKNARARSAAKRPLHLLKSRISIPGQRHAHARTLKRSARQKIAKENAPRLWNLPRIDVDGLRDGQHRQASFLGLPTEIRAQISYASYSIGELEEDVKDLSMGNDRHLSWAGNFTKLRESVLR